MKKLQSQKFVLDDFNNGNSYKNGDTPNPNDFNKLAEGLSFATEKLDLNPLNIENGLGKYSVVQKTGNGGSHGSSDENHKKQSTATGRNAVAFGVQGESIGDCTLTAGYQAKALEKGCVAFGTGIAGRTSAEWIAYYWDSTNWRSNHYGGIGSLEEITGDVPEDYANKGILRIKKDIDGNATTDYKYYYVLGHSNCKYGSFLLNPSFAEGQGTKAKGMWSHTQGYQAIADADFADASGQQTKSHGHHGHAGGYSSTNNSPYGFAHGHIVETSEDVEAQVAVGKFSKKDDTAQFIVGIGKAGGKKNGFSVGNDYDNPSIKVGDTQLTEAKLKDLINDEGSGGISQEQLDKKVDEWEGNAGGNYTLRARIANSAGAQTTYLPVSTTPKQYSIPYMLNRNSGNTLPAGANGYLVIAEPINDYHAVPKKFVLENKGTQLYKHSFDSVINEPSETMFTVIIISTRSTPYIDYEDISSDISNYNILQARIVERVAIENEEGNYDHYPSNFYTNFAFMGFMVGWKYPATTRDNVTAIFTGDIPQFEVPEYAPIPLQGE